MKSITHLGAIFSNLYYGWFMVGIVSAMRMLGGGLHGYGFTVFFLPVSEDLGLNRAQTSLAFSLARAEGAIEAPVVGYLVDRLGPKPLMVTAALFAGVGYIALSWINSYTGFLITYLGLISLAYSAGFIQTPMVVANNWFIRKRARAMTVVGAAVTVGGTLITPLLAIVVNGWGWRWGAFLAGCAFLLICMPLSLQIKRSPESIGLRPDGDEPAVKDHRRGSDGGSLSKSSLSSDVSPTAAMKTLAFWSLAFSMLARVATQSTMMVHFIPIMVWKGISQEKAALLLSAFALLNLGFHFFSRLDCRPDEQTPADFALDVFSSGRYFDSYRGRVAFFALALCHPVLHSGCGFPGDVGDQRRFFRPQTLCDDSRQYDVLLYVGAAPSDR